MKIGYACVPLGADARTNRGFVLKNFELERFYKAVDENLSDLLKILQYNIKNNIHLFRISSDIIPFGSHEINQVNWTDMFEHKLESIGDFIKNNNIRVSMHPGQYTVLNSPNSDTALRAVKDIEYHTTFLDSLKLDYTHKIVLHIGGAYNNKETSKGQFMNNFNKLSDSAKRRLIIENDDRSFTIEDVLEVASKLSIPAVFDNLHHKLNPSIGSEISEILRLVESTWKSWDGNMKLHYSDQSDIKKGGAHSEYVYTDNFLNYFDKVKAFNPDIMLEVKDKDISAIKCVNLITEGQKQRLKESQWAKYKYVVMEKDYSLYKKCSSTINSADEITEFYRTIDYALGLPYSESNYINTLQHVWGYFKDLALEKEKNQFFKKLEAGELPKAKEYLGKLAHKYESEYLLNSYYFKY